MTRRRLSIRPIIAAVAVVMSLAVATGCGKAGADDENVTLDLALPSVFNVIPYELPPGWSPLIVNRSGEKLTNAVLRITIEDPGESQPPMRIGQELGRCEPPEDNSEMDPELKAECDAHDESCEFSGAREEVYGNFGREAKCSRDIATGESSFWLTLQMFGHIDTEQFQDYPESLSVHGELTVDGQAVASDEQELAVDIAAAYQRVAFDGVADTLSSGKGEEVGFDWSFTVTNDSDEELRDAPIAIHLDGGVGYQAELSTGEGGCVAESGDHFNSVECGDYVIPAGESRTWQMTFTGFVWEEAIFRNDCRDSGDECVRQVDLGVDMRGEDHTTLATGQKVVTLALVD